MSTDTEIEVDAPPSPFPDPIVYLWLSLLEGLVAFGLTVFSIALLEGGEIIPDILEEWTIAGLVFVVIVAATFGLRLYKDGYIGR